jgi:hypothetical protein
MVTKYFCVSLPEFAFFGQNERMESIITQDQAKQQRMEAVYTHEESVNARARLVLAAKTVAERHQKLANLWAAIEDEPDYPLQSEAPILALSDRDYEWTGRDAERALANSIAASRKKVADAARVRRIHCG